MIKRITLGPLDSDMLTDIFDYVLLDDKEKNDFIENFGDHWFNEHDVLILEKVSRDAQNHIYFKVEFMRQSLVEVLNT